MERCEPLATPLPAPDAPSVSDHDARLAQVRSDFLAEMNHELRTPLTSILGMTRQLRTSRLDPQQAEALTAIEKASETLMSVVLDVLDHARLEEGRMRPESVVFDPRVLAETTLKVLAKDAAGKGLDLSWWASPDLPRALRGDPGRIRRVLLMLLAHAVKSTEDGRIVLDVRAAGPQRVRFEVRDTGPGWEPGPLAALFSADSREMGLKLVKRLSQVMGGEVGAESVLGQGSMFWVELPLAAVSGPQRDAAAPKAPSPRFPGLFRVLLVEDNAINAKIVHALLEKWGFPVRWVSDGRQALEALSEGKTELVLMDCQMPELDGYEAAREWRRREAESGSGRLPIVALTAHALDGDRERCLAAGMDDYLTKPVRDEELRAALGRWLKV